MAQRAMVKITAMECRRLGDLDSYLVQLQLLIQQLMAGDEGVTDGFMIGLIMRHLTQCAGCNATFAAYRILPKAEQTSTRLLRLLQDLNATYRPHAEAREDVWWWCVSPPALRGQRPRQRIYNLLT